MVRLLDKLFFSCFHVSLHGPQIPINVWGSMTKGFNALPHCCQQYHVRNHFKLDPGTDGGNSHQSNGYIGLISTAFIIHLRGPQWYVVHFIPSTPSPYWGPPRCEFPHSFNNTLQPLVFLSCMETRPKLHQPPGVFVFSISTGFRFGLFLPGRQGLLQCWFASAFDASAPAWSFPRSSNALPQMQVLRRSAFTWQHELLLTTKNEM